MSRIRGWYSGVCEQNWARSRAEDPGQVVKISERECRRFASVSHRFLAKFEGWLKSQWSGHFFPCCRINLTTLWSDLKVEIALKKWIKVDAESDIFVPALKQKTKTCASGSSVHHSYHDQSMSPDAWQMLTPTLDCNTADTWQDDGAQVQRYYFLDFLSKDSDVKSVNFKFLSFRGRKLCFIRSSHVFLLPFVLFSLPSQFH